MNRELIKEKLKEIKLSNDPVETGVPLSYRGKTRRFDSFQIPLSYLMYNKKNGRIASRVKSYEKEREEIDVETEEGKVLIEKFLWGAHPADNEQTQESIARKGQLVRGIVTNEGIIIDGNRRASILNRIYSQREFWAKKGVDVDHAKYFIAIILPDDVTREEVEEIEVETQFGEEEKIDYNPIEKYLKCRDLSKSAHTNFDIHRKMNVDVKIIDRYQEIMSLMDEYLEYCGCEGIYTQLDEREDLFIKLNESLKKYNKGRGISWNCDETEINELKSIAFDYIRTKYEGKEFRELFTIFEKKKEIWEKFKEKHFQAVSKVNEPVVSEILGENSDNETKALKERDTSFSEIVKSNFEDNLQEKISVINDLEDADKPEKLINKAINALDAINPDLIDKAKKEEVKESLNQVISLITELVKRL